jgi:hypothetical protein
VTAPARSLCHRCLVWIEPCQGSRLLETKCSRRIKSERLVSCLTARSGVSRVKPSRFKLENTGLVARVYIRNGNSAQTKRAQTRRDKDAVKVRKRKACEKELNQYESEIRRQCSCVGRVYQDGNEEKWKGSGVVQHSDV